MENTRNVLLALVRCALWEREYDGPSEITDWPFVLRIAHQQTVLGLVAESISRLPEGLAPDSKSRMKLQSSLMRIYQTHALLNRKIAEVSQMMLAKGINTVLLKGQGVALVYPNPLSRQCGDIDLYVGESKFLDALDAIEPNTRHKISKYSQLKHFSVYLEGVEIEIHRVVDFLPNISANRIFQNWTVRSLQGPDLRRIEINGVEINLPPADFDAIYILNHSWYHFMTGGVGLRQLCDWAMHLHRFHDLIDREILMVYLEDFGLIRAWQIFASIAVRHLGLPVEECLMYNPEYDTKADRALEIMWSEGNFGKHSVHCTRPRPKGHFAGKLHSFIKNTSRIIRVLSVSPYDVVSSWLHYSILGIRNIFVRQR